MDIILYLLNIIQYFYRRNCWLINFTCRYILLKQWTFDNSRSPKHQKFRIGGLPLITDSRQDWVYKDLILYYEKRYGKMIRPIGHRSDYHIPDDCSCPRCNVPEPFLYRNNGSKGQLLCRTCDTRFSPDGSRFLLTKLCCPHCNSSPALKKDHKHFIVHKCVSPKHPYYLHNLKKVDNQNLKDEFGKSKYKLHYVYREFTADLSSMGLSSLPENASPLEFNKYNVHVMSLVLTLYANLGLSLRKTPRVLRDPYSISLSHQQIANYCGIAVVCIKPPVGQYPYEKGAVFTTDKTYIRIRGTKTYIWLIVSTASHSIIGRQVPDNRGVGPCIFAMRTTLQGLTKLPGNFKFTANGYSAYPLAAMEFVENFGRPFTFHITRVIGFTSNDTASKGYRPFRQVIERLNRTYKVSCRYTNDLNSTDGADYEPAL